MAYQKQIWENLPSTNTPVSAERLNHMEDGIAEAWEHGGGGAGETLKIGTILPFSGGYGLIPTGYMLCDGSEISRTDYSDLFNIIGTNYGIGDGSTTFNLPDLKGRVLVGQNSEDTDFDTLGQTGGGKQTIIPMQWYNDFVDMRLKAGFNIPNWENYRRASTGSTTVIPDENSQTAVMGINENTTVDTNGNLQPYTVINYIIKVSQTTPTQAQVVDGYSTSTTDSYSCNYVNELNNYSTTEQIIGKWIDDKPIYRKVIQTTTGTTTNSWTKIANLQIDNLIKKEGYWIAGTEKYSFDRSYNNEEMTTYWKSDGIYEIHNYSYANNRQATLIVEYTKIAS